MSKHNKSCNNWGGVGLKVGDKWTCTVCGAEGLTWQELVVPYDGRYDIMDKQVWKDYKETLAAKKLVADEIQRFEEKMRELHKEYRVLKEKCSNIEYVIRYMASGFSKEDALKGGHMNEGYMHNPRVVDKEPVVRPPIDLIDCGCERER